VGNALAQGTSGTGVVELLDNGSVFSVDSQYGGLSVAVDGIGNIWSLDPSGSIAWVRLDQGPVLTHYSTLGLNGANHLAIDGDDHVWFTNGNGTLTLSSNPLPTSGNAPLDAAVPLETIAVSGLSTPSAISIDLSGNVWVTDSTNNTINEVIGGAGPALPLVNAVVKVSPGTRP
jgi:sugar lactone lactonase YvrE